MSYFVTPTTWCWNYGVGDTHIGHDRASDEASVSYGRGARGTAEAQVDGVPASAYATPAGATALVTDDAA